MRIALYCIFIVIAASILVIVLIRGILEIAHIIKVNKRYEQELELRGKEITRMAEIITSKLKIVEKKQSFDRQLEKKLKALEIIKQVIPIEEEDFFIVEEINSYFFLGKKVSKEQFDLLKEELL